MMPIKFGMLRLVMKANFWLGGALRWGWHWISTPDCLSIYWPWPPQGGRKDHKHEDFGI